MKKTITTLSILGMSLVANATELKCKIEPDILPETFVIVPVAPGIARAGQLGGIMSELSILENGNLEISILEGSKELANVKGSPTVKQTAKGVASNGTTIEVTCSPK